MTTTLHDRFTARLRTLRAATISALLAAPTAPALADVISAPDAIPFVTEGRVADESAGSAYRFEGQEGVLSAEGSSTLGVFAFDTPAPGETTAVEAIPFAIEVQAPTLDRTIDDPASPLPSMIENRVVLKGILDGTVAGTGGDSDLSATIELVRPGELDPADPGMTPLYDFPIPPEAIATGEAFALDDLGDGRFALRAQLVDPSPVPEPTAIALLLMAGVGYGVRRLRRR